MLRPASRGPGQPDGQWYGPQGRPLPPGRDPRWPDDDAVPTGRDPLVAGTATAPPRHQAPPPTRPARRTAGRRRRSGRIRTVLRLRTVRVIVALFAVFLCLVGVSVGRALAAPGGGSLSSKLAEWARDHYLGPVVTFGEWLSYSPPKVGGKPQFSLAAPKSHVRFRHVQGFKPIIPAPLRTFAGTPLPGEGVWRVLETVHGEPAMFGTYLRPSSVYTSYVAGIVSMDQRLLSFQLRPGSEDPGPGNWGEPDWIPPGTRAGLMATFNGGFRLNTDAGGFYLNGITKSPLVNGDASVVYYRNGTVRIGEWGRDLQLTPNVLGVRQNLKLIVDHGQVPASVNTDVIASWGATLGGGYYVWRSGLGITADGRIIFVYGPALNVQELASLLQRAGATEALQLDINPYWMSFEYYKAGGRPADPAPVNLLPTQQQSAYRYYSPYSRDFTAVYAR